MGWPSNSRPLKAFLTFLASSCVENLTNMRLPSESEMLMGGRGAHSPSSVPNLRHSSRTSSSSCRTSHPSPPLC